MGHWSSWQEYGTRSFPFDRFEGDDLDNGLQAFQYSEATSSATSWPNMVTQLAVQLSSARSGASTFSVPAGFANVQFAADKSNRNSGSGLPGFNWHSSVQLGQAYISFVDPGHESDLDPSPPLLATLTQGVDWDYNPDTGDAVQYEGLATRTGWEDWHTTVDVGVAVSIPATGWDVDTTSGVETTTYSDYNQTYYWRALSFDPRGLWVPWNTGVTVGIHTGHSTVAQPNYPDDLVLALSGLGNVGAINLAVQPGSLGSEGVPFSDFTISSGQVAQAKTRIYQQGATTRGIESYRFGGDRQPGPAVVYQQPRFRYWVPSPLTIPPLRLNQRDDGFGATSGHSRLNLAGTVPNQSASINDARIQRVGGRNTYL